MKKIWVLLVAILLLTMFSGCQADRKISELNTPGQIPETGDPSARTGRDNTYVKREGVEVIYLAGGCFWGTEKLMQTIDGVITATSGYANGKEDIVPDYGNVSDTGFKETVRVEYDPKTVSLDTLLFAYFRSIDPTIKNRQGNDMGTQYQAGVYWADDAAKEIVLRIADVERGRYEEFAVEIEALTGFFDAEEYHQDYLDKNPDGYCHIAPEEFELVRKIIVDPADYPRPTEEEIKAKLTETQYAVTQQDATELPFKNEFWDNHEKGVYVDIVTGEPLFSSGDKFDSGSGWPSFTKGIDENSLVLLKDLSLGSMRTEVRSRAGNSHLGHVFYGKNESPSGVRYCINSAALRFIAFEDMQKEGYGYLMEYID